MHVDFYCAKCGQLMRMGDEAVGKQARCPACGAINVVPAPMIQPSSLASQPNNPYQAPGNASLPDPAAGAPVPGGIVPTIIDAGDIMSRAWAIFQDQLGNCIGILFAAYLISQTPAFLIGVVKGVVVASAGQNGNQQDLAMIEIGFSLLQIATIPFTVWINIGMTLFALKVARGRPGEFSDIFSGGQYFLPILGASILFWLMLTLGFVACIVPMVFLAIMFFEFYYLILDGRAGVISSFSLSKQITENNWGAIFLLWLISVGLWLATAPTCFIGMIFVGPLLKVIWAVAYLAMTGQPTGEKLLNRLQSPGPAGQALR